MFSAWLANFSSLITANPSSYGLMASDATTIAGYNTSWIAAYTPVTMASTKTPAAIAAKNTEYAMILPQLRKYAQQVANNAGVSSANKIALGLNPKTSTPAKITAPNSNPVLTIQSQSTGSIILRYRDSAASVSVKAKPYGVTACVIRGMVATAPPASPATMPILANATKSPYQLSTAGMTAGATLYLVAVWGTRTQNYSPVSPMISATVT
jgi:hypothetical protein